MAVIDVGFAWSRSSRASAGRHRVTRNPRHPNSGGPRPIESNSMAWSRFLPIALVLLLTACSVSSPPPAGNDFEIAKGLEMTLWASEPLVVNPTNFDIDERGRVWFIESVNYRSDLKSKPKNDLAGDRIVILEDTDGDGQADHRKVFDQHQEMLAPLGISVLGNKVIVSQSPDLFVYTKDEDDRIISKETLLTGWSGIDHDHGLHAVLFGHDGRYYFNSGDQGFDVTDRSGQAFRSSSDGPYYAATVQTVKPDGTDFRVLAHNARNPYEIALDSFGSIWQTDNDDDGNQWTRLLYVMEGANFGYWGPGGRRWRADKGTHFHEERPETVPYVARTGPGSPTGLVFYEGELLSPRYRNQLLHAEPGKRLIQTFFVRPHGAGFAMEAENTVASTDPIFRPSDLAVAPDGAVFIADWQDPVVGGHNMLDIERGRIFRLAPAEHRSSVPTLELETEGGVLAAFGSPNQATRYRAYQELMLRGEEERAALLLRAWRDGSEALKARALWMLAGLGDDGKAALEEALGSSDPRFRVLALRVSRMLETGSVAVLAALADDPDPQVRREVALFLRDVPVESRTGIWLQLADGYDGADRWYLSALRIGASGAEDAIFAALRRRHADWDPLVADLYWVLQAPTSGGYLSSVVDDDSRPVEQRLQALDALGWLSSPRIARFVAAIAADQAAPLDLRNRSLYFLAKQLYSDWSEVRTSPAVLAAIGRGLDEEGTRSQALDLAALLPDPALADSLGRLAADQSAVEDDRGTALRTLGQIRGKEVASQLRMHLSQGSPALRIAAIDGLGAADPEGLSELLVGTILSDSPNEVRSAALRVLGRGLAGMHLILDLEQSQDLPAEMRTLASGIVNSSRDATVRQRARELLPPPKSRNERPVIRPREIIEAVGSVERGREVYHRTDGANCAKCHSLTAGEERVGPSLAAIGSKYGKAGMLNEIVYPSAGIAPEYRSWILDTGSHGLITGLLVEDTADRVVVRTENADEIQLAPEDILERRQANLSIMPEDLVGAMTTQELIDLLEFLSTLQADSGSAG